jgi:hypothetical protein
MVRAYDCRESEDNFGSNPQPQQKANRILPELAFEALEAQKAPSLRGLSKSYATAIEDLCVTLKMMGVLTYDVNTHPIAIAWAGRLAQLSCLGVNDQKYFEWALEECAKLAKDNPGGVSCYSCPVAHKLRATHRLWCPTWIGSERGPIDICEEHARTFKEDKNPSAKNGSWHWGEDADKAFKSVVLNIHKDDDRFYNAKNMAENGSKVGEQTYVVDGEVWLVASYNVLHLGKWPDVKETFPKLFTV